MKKGIAVAGNLIMDYYKQIDVYPEHSNLTTIHSVQTAIGGAVCSCAIDLARIDPVLPVYAYGIVGEDESGHEIVRQMSAYPMLNCDGIQYQGQTSFTDVLEDLTNHTRTFFQYRGANAHLSDKHFDFTNFPASFIHIGYILLLDGMDAEDSTYGTVMARVLARAQAAGIKTSIDVVSEASDRFKKLVPPALKYSDYCIINELEASKTCGIPVRDVDGKLSAEQLKKVLHALKAMGVKEWVVIHAREGAIGLDKEGNYALSPALQLEPSFIKGTTGAGDAFLSGTLYGAWAGQSLQEAIELGIASAAASLGETSSTAGVKPEAELRLFYESMAKENWEGFTL